MSTVARTYQIDAGALPDARKAVDKINRRAERKGMDGRYTITAEETVLVPVYAERVGSDGHLRTVKIGDREEVLLTVEGDAPRYAGWTFVAVLDNDPEAGVIVKTVPDVADGLDLAAFRDRANVCEHCASKRHRRTTYVLRRDDGKLCQVGSSCIEAFLGVPVRWTTPPDADPFASTFEGFPQGETRPPVEAALLASVVAERLWGFVTRAAAKRIDHLDATADLVRAALLPFSKSDMQLNRKLLEQATTDDRDKAEQVRAWAREQSGGDYLDNLAALAAADTVASRNLGLLCSAVPAYNREQAEQVTRAARAVSEWQGTKGERITVGGEVTVADVSTATYGRTETFRTLLVVRDQLGNLYKWRASKRLDVDRGDHVRIKATVADHNTYGDARQTVLTRGALLETTPASTDENGPTP